MEYVSRIDGLLEASLSREALAEEDIECRLCDKGNSAVWRCKDCSMGIPMCRGCLRKNHKQNPFHRIEQWNGQFFCAAELWEVGTYLLVPHHDRKLSCNIIKSQQDFLEMLEDRNDVAEQEELKRKGVKTSNSATSRSSASCPSGNEWDDLGPPNDEDIDMSYNREVADDMADEEFIRYLQELRDGDDGRDSVEFDTQGDVDDDVDEEEPDVPILNHYLPNERDAEQEGRASAQRVMGTYVRVVHTNGIHNIAMISCQCQGHDQLASDLLASRLLPCSFERVRTIFSAQLLDYFRLSNLEVKATAYQFYHLLQRLTNPMDPATVINLYREFRRMTRIWRWMKRLKWAGFSNTHKKASDVMPGQLSVFCPACPQPGINIPENWKEDQARYV